MKVLSLPLRFYEQEAIDNFLNLAYPLQKLIYTGIHKCVLVVPIAMIQR